MKINKGKLSIENKWVRLTKKSALPVEWCKITGALRWKKNKTGKWIVNRPSWRVAWAYNLTFKSKKSKEPSTYSWTAA